MKQWFKKLTGADLIIGLFLIVTIPHTAMILSAFEYKDWWLLAWSLAGAVDIGIAYGGVVSSNVNADKEARQWATALFMGLSIGSYCLNVAHYVVFQAGLFSVGLGAFFPIGILLLAKIKSLLYSSRQKQVAPLPEIDIEQVLGSERAKYQRLLEDKDSELAKLSQNYQRELTKLQNSLPTADNYPAISWQEFSSFVKSRPNQTDMKSWFASRFGNTD